MKIIKGQHEFISDDFDEIKFVREFAEFQDEEGRPRYIQMPNVTVFLSNSERDVTIYNPDIIIEYYKGEINKYW